MDIQKELNEWADWFIPHDSKDLRDALELNSFNQLNVEKLLAINGLAEAYAFRAKDSWKAWQAAKAKAVPEGFVVVPVQCPDPDFADMLFDELRKNAIGTFGDDLLIHFSDIDEEKIWALMVEAAKAQAVPGQICVTRERLQELIEIGVKAALEGQK